MFSFLSDDDVTAVRYCVENLRRPDDDDQQEALRAMISAFDNGQRESFCEALNSLDVRPDELRFSLSLHEGDPDRAPGEEATPPGNTATPPHDDSGYLAALNERLERVLSNSNVKASPNA